MPSTDWAGISFHYAASNFEDKTINMTASK